SQPEANGRCPQCPAHRDESPSLSASTGSDGRVLVHCHAGCSLESILGALRISPAHLFRSSSLSPQQHVDHLRLRVSFPPVARSPRGSRAMTGFRFEAAHDYGDWRLIRSRHPRTGEKRLEWEHRGAGGAWIRGLGGADLSDLPLYNEKQVLMGAAAGETIVVVESESSVDALGRRGIYATTWAGGAARQAASFL